LELTITIYDLQYSTSIISLATYIHCEGYRLLKADTTQFPTVFIFTSDSKLDDIIHNYECGKAICNPKQYYESYKLLISKLKDNGNNKNNKKRLM
jgi:hypothetical protein